MANVWTKQSSISSFTENHQDFPCLLLPDEAVTYTYAYDRRDPINTSSSTRTDLTDNEMQA